MFICSLGLIRKEIGYTTQRIYDLLKLLSKEKVIKVNLSRWDRLYDDKGKLMDDKILIIEAIDKPDTYKGFNDEGKEVDIPNEPKDDNYYISLDMPLMQHYINIGLNERYFGLHCLLNKLSNNTEGKSWMSINNMADVLGFGDKTVNSMIYELNRNYLLYSRYQKSSKKVMGKGKENGAGTETGTMFEHHLLGNLDHKDRWMDSFKESVDKNIKKWDKKIEGKE